MSPPQATTPSSPPRPRGDGSGRLGTYTFTGDDTLTIAFEAGVGATWTVQFPNATALHLGGTGIQGGTFVDASSLPAYAPTSAR